jgi:long-subunit fatty acid transport protein
LTDNYNSSLEYDYTDQNNDGPLLSESPDGSFNYNLKTPRVISGSVGAVIARSGFVSAEVQYKNFGQAQFDYTSRGNGIAFQDEENAVNRKIDMQLGNAFTIRTGAELAIKKFRVRGGIEMDQSPYTNDETFDLTYNAGVGFRGNAFFIDFAFQYFTLAQGLLPYVVYSVPQPFVSKDISNSRLFLTLAYRWK